MIYTDLDICNRALRKIKQNMITSLNEDSKEASHCKFLYPMIKAEVLSKYSWKCAIKTLELSSKKTTNYKLDYKYEFFLPRNCLRILNVNGNTNYHRDGQYIYHNSEIIKLLYIANVDEEFLSINVANVIACKMAVELSYSFFDNSTLIGFLQECYNREYKEALDLDSQEGAISNYIELDEPTWIQARN